MDNLFYTDEQIEELGDKMEFDAPRLMRPCSIVSYNGRGHAKLSIIGVQAQVRLERIYRFKDSQGIRIRHRELCALLDIPFEQLKLKRNDVVIGLCDGWFYGRINRMIGNDQVEVICCGKHITVYFIDEVIKHDYKGTWRYFHGRSEDHRVFSWMPSLRKLKQMRARYDKTVWKHRRKSQAKKGL